MRVFETLQAEDPQQVGPYRIEARLGSGGMGRVYLGRSKSGRAVAVKVVRPELADDRGFRRRFSREVTLARAVSGFYTAGVVDADPEGAQPWLATAYVPGISLDDAVDEYGPWPEASVLALGAGLAEALESIHAAGVVHRDMKPSNVLLAADGPRVIDFGISLAAEGSRVTQTGMAVGTPGFMSPEQLSGVVVGPASDVFCLGAVLVFAATGAGPFGTGSWQGVWYRTVNQEPDLDTLPSRLRDVVARCLAKKPEQRPSVADLLDELAETASAGTTIAEVFTQAAWLPAAVAQVVRARAGTTSTPERQLVPGDGPTIEPSGSAPREHHANSAPQEHHAPTIAATRRGDAVALDGSDGPALDGSDVLALDGSDGPAPHTPATLSSDGSDTQASQVPRALAPDAPGIHPPRTLDALAPHTPGVLSSDGPEVLASHAPPVLTTDALGVLAPDTPEPVAPDTLGVLAPDTPEPVAPHTLGVLAPDTAPSSGTGSRAGGHDGTTSQPAVRPTRVSRRHAMLGLAGVGAAALGFVSWRSRGTGTTNDKPVQSPSPALSASGSSRSAGKLLWEFSTGGSIGSSPVVVEGVVYFGSDDYKLYAVNAGDGSERWSFSAQDSVPSTPAVVDGLVYFGSDDNTLYAVNAGDGSERWRFSIDNDVESSPTVVDDVVYFGADGRLYALDADMGTERWNFPTSDSVRSSPTVVDGVVYFGSDDNTLYAVNAGDGSGRWSFATDDSVESSPVVVDGFVYFGSSDGNFYALHAETGVQRWKVSHDDEVLSSPTVVDGVVYFGSDDNKLYALDVSSGELRWTSAAGGAVSSPTVVDGVAYFGTQATDTGDFRAVNVKTGGPLWRFSPTDGVSTTPAVAAGVVYFGSENGTLYAVKA